MKIKTLFATTIALTLLGGSIAKSDIPMQVGNDEGEWYLTVPDTDTTTPAYGGKLRLYDVHIAKMVEVTHDSCIRGQYRRPHAWTYTANSGKTSMGMYVISCQLASQLVSAYGLGKDESTLFEGNRTPRMIPTLNITGGKVDKWMRFTQNFKPVR